MFDTREAYLTEAAALILDELLMPIVEQSKYEYSRPPIRISVGFAKGARANKAIAVCFVRKVSSDGVNEIFINPEIDEPTQVLDSLTHELIHAIDDCTSGHGKYKFFGHVARSAGLEGKLTATYAGETLSNYLKTIADLLGAYPHHKMNIAAGTKKQATRMLKIECNSCGFTARTSQKWIDELAPNAACPVCGACSLNHV